MDNTLVTVGMFDGVHLGHRFLLRMLGEESLRQGLAPVVVTFDNHPRQVLGDDSFKMLTTRDERMILLKECGVEDVVLVHFTPTIAQLSATQFVEQVLLRRLGMKALLLGYDNRFGKRSFSTQSEKTFPQGSFSTQSEKTDTRGECSCSDDFDRLSQLGSQRGFAVMQQREVRLYDKIGVSSTRIRDSLAMGDIGGANAMLCHHYTISGMVTKGRGVGRTLGVPTANMDCPQEKLLPCDGVYIALATTSDGKEHKAVVNIGSQPTFGLDKRTIEAHLLNFDGDLYGTVLSLKLCERLRDIHRYDNAQRLADRIALDIELAAAYQDEK